MDCLHCGGPLPFLKKLSGDTRFCSSDHERAWRSSLQEAMLERLRVSAEQFRRAVQKSRAVMVAPAVEPETVPVEQPVVPEMASFSMPRPEPVTVPMEPLIRSVAVPADLGIAVKSVSVAEPAVASQSFPLSTDAHLVVPVDSALVVAAQSS